MFNSNNNELPYVRIMPRTYSNEYLAEDLVQVGTTEEDDYFNNDAQNDTINRIIMKRVSKNDNSINAYTYLEQDYGVSSGNSFTINKLIKMFDL